MNARTLVAGAAAFVAMGVAVYLLRAEEETREEREALKERLVEEAGAHYVAHEQGGSHVDEPAVDERDERDEGEEEEGEEETLPVTPRSMKLVLDKVGASVTAEEGAEDYAMISPRLEAFLEDGKSPRGKSPRVMQPKPAGRGPSAVRTPTKRTKRAPIPKFDLELSDDEELLMDAEEAKRIIQEQRESVRAAETAEKFNVVSPRLDKFLASE